MNYPADKQPFHQPWETFRLLFQRNVTLVKQYVGMLSGELRPKARIYIRVRSQGTVGLSVGMSRTMLARVVLFILLAEVACVFKGGKRH